MDPGPVGGTGRVVAGDVRWPAQCCVPAFLIAAMRRYAADNLLVLDDKSARIAAHTIGVIVGPSDPNPWGLPTSDHSDEHGVTVERAMDNFERLLEQFEMRERLRLAVVPLNTITFELYENALIELSKDGTTIAIAFSYPDLIEGHGARTSTLLAAGRHLCRLTPLSAKEMQEQTILSSNFQFDYSGTISMFDNSGRFPW